MRVWECKIGGPSLEALPPGADGPMREAVEKAYRKLTGTDPEFTFSGWDADLTEAELAAHENRMPDPAKVAREIDDAIELKESALAFMDGDQ